jgi:hypothetical protein
MHFSSGNSGLNFIGQISRVQSADLSVGINRTDINEFGQLNRIDTEILAPPTFTLNFTYFPTDGQNENILGFNAKGGSFISGILTKVTDAKNYFISVSPQGVDDDTYNSSLNRDVYSIGNGFISNYSLNASIGQPVSASVSVDGLNVVYYSGSSGQNIPAVDPYSANRITTWNFALPVGDPYTGSNTISVLRPGDITLSIPNGSAMGVQTTGTFGVNIQSFSLSIPIGRENLNRLGSPFGFSREIQFPVNVSLRVDALMTDLQAGGFDTLLCNDALSNLSILMRQPSCNGTGLDAIRINVNQAAMVNQSFSHSIGGDSRVSIEWSAQLAGANSSNGVVFSGFF